MSFQTRCCSRELKKGKRRRERNCRSGRKIEKKGSISHSHTCVKKKIRRDTCIRGRLTGENWIFNKAAAMGRHLLLLCQASLYLFLSMFRRHDDSRFESGIMAQLYYRHRHRCTPRDGINVIIIVAWSLRSRDIANGKREHVAGIRLVVEVTLYGGGLRATVCTRVCKHFRQQLTEWSKRASTTNFVIVFFFFRELLVPVHSLQRWISVLVCLILILFTYLLTVHRSINFVHIYFSY